MKQYIDKSTVIAEIERKLNSYHPTEVTSGIYALMELRDFLNTIESKDVDLNEEIIEWKDLKVYPECVNIRPLQKVMDIVNRTAKHFFDLGIKTQKGE